MTKRHLPRLSILLAGVLLLTLAACARQPGSTADVPRHVSQGHRISVAPFTQPLHPGQLIVGQIPEPQGRIPHDALVALDRELREVLITGTNRQYTFIPRQNLPADLTNAHSTGQPGALPRWVAYGRQHGAQYLLIPQVLDWHEREGSSAGVTQSAHVRVEFFLVNVAGGELGPRSIFEEKQVGLTENLLTVGEFFKRKGAWVSAQELAVDGMKKAVKDLGL
ncbi:hypothetical protein [Desulfovibrio sp.]|uniref:hypothetical protein n=1 Tax=Desulfovibrio sp. TaxID=885 RepID=UPI0023C9CE32|nr:hypothetical protein [Desulfovibrio sp.]MDE7241794.1 hypothetical protein [Desulfovibrio sp.]